MSLPNRRREHWQSPPRPPALHPARKKARAEASVPQRPKKPGGGCKGTPDATTAGPVRQPPGPGTFCWQHPATDQLLRINFRLDDSRAVTGMNALGLRQRHAVWEQWLRAATPVTEVVARLGEANFDPGFFRRHEPAVRAAFAQQFPDLPLATASAGRRAARPV